MKKIILFTSAVVSLTLGSVQMQAQIISVNFYTPTHTSPTDVISGSDVAGAGTASTTNWNNILATGNPSGTNLLDNSLNATTMDFSFDPNGSGPATLGPGGSTGTDKLFGSGREGSNNSSFTSTFTLSQIPYSSYNLYLYFNASFPDRRDSFNIGSTTYYAQTSTDFTNYVQATSTTAGVYTSSNYVLFTGLTGASQLLTAIALNGNSTNFVGFQIEAVPEPSTYALLGFGLMAVVLVRHWRRKSA